MQAIEYKVSSEDADRFFMTGKAHAKTKLLIWKDIQVHVEWLGAAAFEDELIIGKYADCNYISLIVTECAVSGVKCWVRMVPCIAVEAGHEGAVTV